MRIYNPQPTEPLLPDLHDALAKLRHRRGFDVERYLTAKTVLLNEYMLGANLDSCVIAVSGGVDSAVVLGLAQRASSLPESPIKKILALLLPIFDVGATHQSAATARGEEVARTFGIQPVTIDLSAGHAALKAAVDTALDVTGQPWASGQLVSYVRTPALYYATSLLTQQGHAGIVIGTTNRDEGGYLGFIGKASDAMVDVQLISDLHKSEVYTAARALGVPASVLNETPSGDMYDGRPDEAVFGAPYDFVELYLLWKDLFNEEARASFLAGWTSEAKTQFEFFAHNLEELHRYNLHKYLGKSPAVHLDILKSSTPGGWDNSYYLAHVDPPVDASRVNGFFTLDRQMSDTFHCAPDPEIDCKPIGDFGDSALLPRGVLRLDEIEALRNNLAGCPWIPVGLNGIKDDFHPEIDAIGSWRATAYDPIFAHALWNRMGRFVTPRMMDSSTPTDWDGSRVWRAVGVNPLLRFIRYAHGGTLIPHYDAPFVYHEGKRTLMSVLLYIDTGDGAGSATRLLRDPQDSIPVTERDLRDWTRFPTEEEVLLRVAAEPGDCLVLDHRILHDSEAYTGKLNKLILRTDIVFERCRAADTHA